MTETTIMSTLRLKSSKVHTITAYFSSLFIFRLAEQGGIKVHINFLKRQPNKKKLVRNVLSFLAKVLSQGVSFSQKRVVL